MRSALSAVAFVLFLVRLASRWPSLTRSCAQRSTPCQATTSSSRPFGPNRLIVNAREGYPRVRFPRQGGGDRALAGLRFTGGSYQTDVATIDRLMRRHALA